VFVSEDYFIPPRSFFPSILKSENRRIQYAWISDIHFDKFGLQMIITIGSTHGLLKGYTIGFELYSFGRWMDTYQLLFDDYKQIAEKVATRLNAPKPDFNVIKRLYDCQDKYKHKECPLNEVYKLAYELSNTNAQFRGTSKLKAAVLKEGQKFHKD
jgi:hypothetical protein